MWIFNFSLKEVENYPCTIEQYLVTVFFGLQAWATLLFVAANSIFFASSASLLSIDSAIRLWT